MGYAQRFQWIVLIGLMFWSFLVNAFVDIPPISRVVDQTNTLTPQQRNQISMFLQQFEAKTGAQIAVILIPTTSPETIEQYSIRVAENWKLGRKNIDDGAILLIAKDDRVMRIEVGYGLEGALNDATCQRIISETITPYFKNKNFYGGIVAGLTQITHVIQGEPLPKPKKRVTNNQNDGRIFVGAIFAYTVLYLLSMLTRSVFPNAHNKALKVENSLVSSIFPALFVYFFTHQVIIMIGAGILFFILSFFFTKQGAIFGGGSGWGSGSGGGGGFSGGGGGFGGGGSSGRW